MADREDEQYDKEAEILGKGGYGLVLVKDRTGCLYVSLCLLALGVADRGQVPLCARRALFLPFPPLPAMSAGVDAAKGGSCAPQRAD